MQINSHYNYNKPSFGAHLTQQFIKIVEHTNPAQTEEKFARRGIKADFANNPVLAACCWQCAKIFEALHIKLPKSITAKDLPFDIGGYADTGFNTFFNIHDFKNISDLDNWHTSLRQYSLEPTDHFLMIILHEFSHIAHFNRLEENRKWTNTSLYSTLSLLKQIPPPFELKEHILKYKKYYLKGNAEPGEIFADTMTARIASVLDAKTLMPKSNPFEEISVYKEKPNLPKEENIFNKFLAHTYNGNIEQVIECLNEFLANRTFSTKLKIFLEKHFT